MWFGTMEFYNLPFSWEESSSQPTDEVIFFRGVGIPPTSKMFQEPGSPEPSLAGTGSGEVDPDFFVHVKNEATSKEDLRNQLFDGHL